MCVYPEKKLTDNEAGRLIIFNFIHVTNINNTCIHTVYIHKQTCYTYVIHILMDEVYENAYTIISTGSMCAKIQIKRLSVYHLHRILVCGIHH